MRKNGFAYLLYLLTMALIVIVALIVVAKPAHADTLFAKNAGGGWIVLFEHKCSVKELDGQGRQDSYSFTPSEDWRGCWEVADNTVTIYWSDGDTTVVPLALFKTLQPWMRPYTEYQSVHASVR